MRKRILISIATSLAISAVVLFIISIIMRDIRREVARASIYSEIENKTDALNLLISSFPNRPDKTRIRQINMLRDSLGNFLEGFNPIDQGEQFLIKQIRINYDSLGYSFDKLISSLSEPSETNFEDRRNNFLIQLSMKNQFIYDDIRLLMEISQSRINAAQYKAAIWISILIIGLILINAAISFFAGRSIITAQESLRRSEAILRAIFEALSEGIIFLDPQGIVVKINNAMKKSHGDTLQGLTNPSLNSQSIIRPNGTPFPINEQPPVVALKTGQSMRDVEMGVTTSEGKVRWQLVNAQPVLDDRGNLLGAVASFFDITDRKRAEQELQYLNETLEKQVSERSKLAEERSRKLQTLAVELIEAEERERQRISVWLHDDLQQVLAAARMQLEACQLNSPEPIISSVVQLLEESISKARGLSHELSPEVLHHSGLARSMKWLANRMQQQFGLQAQIQFDAEDKFENPPLKFFIFRAVQELLFNIVKHAGVKDVSVNLSVHDGRFVIKVSDKGAGFDPNLLDVHGGKTGFGILSIRERASYIGGDLLVESAPGQGSRFTLNVPFNIDEDFSVTKVADHERINPFPANLNIITTGLRVLFVDDHKVMRQGLIRLVTGQPEIKVIGEASNGLDAIEIARHLKPDVIVMDISMPKMDGIEATHRIKAEMPNVRIIGLSMFEDELVAQRMRQAGAEAFVSKAASSAELIKAIYGT